MAIAQSTLDALNNGSLNILNLSNTALTSTDITNLASALANNSNTASPVTQIILQSCGLTASSLSTIINAVLNNTVLTTFAVDKNSLGSSASTSLISLIQKNRLTALGLGTAGITDPTAFAQITGALESCPVNLVAFGANLPSDSNDIAATAAASLLKNNNYLKTITFIRNGFTESGLIKIANAINTSKVEALYLGGSSTSSLSTLNNNVASAIAQALTQNTSLKTLGLDYGSIDNTGAAAIRDALANNYVLTSLTLTGNPGITDTSITTAINNYLTRNTNWTTSTSTSTSTTTPTTTSTSTTKISTTSTTQLTSSSSSSTTPALSSSTSTSTSTNPTSTSTSTSTSSTSPSTSTSTSTSSSSTSTSTTKTSTEPSTSTSTTEKTSTSSTAPLTSTMATASTTHFDSTGAPTTLINTTASTSTNNNPSSTENTSTSTHSSTTTSTITTQSTPITTNTPSGSQVSEAPTSSSTLPTSTTTNMLTSTGLPQITSTQPAAQTPSDPAASNSSASLGFIIPLAGAVGGTIAIIAILILVVVWHHSRKKTQNRIAASNHHDGEAPPAVENPLYDKMTEKERINALYDEGNIAQNYEDLEQYQKNQPQIYGGFDNQVNGETFYDVNQRAPSTQDSTYETPVRIPVPAVPPRKNTITATNQNPTYETPVPGIPDSDDPNYETLTPKAKPENKSKPNQNAFFNQSIYTLGDEDKFEETSFSSTEGNEPTYALGNNNEGNEPPYALGNNNEAIYSTPQKNQKTKIKISSEQHIYSLGDEDDKHGYGDVSTDDSDPNHSQENLYDAGNNIHEDLYEQNRNQDYLTVAPSS